MLFERRGQKSLIFISDFWLEKPIYNHNQIMDMGGQKSLVITSKNISIIIPNEFVKMLENA